MTKQEIEAIRSLPDEYVCDGTDVRLVNDCPVAINPVLLPMTYIAGKWHPLCFAHFDVVPYAKLVSAFQKLAPFYKYCPEQQIDTNGDADRTAPVAP